MRWIKYGLKVVIAGGLIYWLIDSGLLDPAPLLAAPLSLAFFLGPVFLLANLFIASWRWAILLRVHHPEVHIRNVITWKWIGKFFGMVTPGGGGGEVARAYYVFRNTEEGKVAALSTVVLDRIIGLYSMLLIGGGSFVVLQFGGGERGQYLDLMGTVILVLFAGISGFFLAFNFEPVREFSLKLVPRRFKQSFAAMFDAYLGRKKALFLCLALSFASQVFLFGIFILAGMHLNTPPGILAALVVVPLVFLANSLPISPGGIGIGEAVASILFMQFGLANGAGIMLIVRLWYMMFQLPGGIIFLLHVSASKKTMRPS